MSQAKERFKSAMWAGSSRKILVGGAGGIGSWTVLFLGRSNDHELVIVDMDTIDELNLAGQFYRNRDVGATKAHALIDNVNLFNNPPLNVFASTNRIETITGINQYPFVISAFDNMDAREYLFNQWKANPDRKLFIDGRLLAEQFEVYYVQKGMEERYEETLFKQSEAEEATCTFKSTSHFAAMCGARIVHGLNAFIANENMNDEFYELPFKHYELGPSWTITAES